MPFLNSLYKKLIGDALWATFSKFFGLSLGILVNIALARILGPNNLGLYFLSSTIVQLFIFIGSFGLRGVAIRLISSNLSKNNSALAYKYAWHTIKLICLAMFLMGGTLFIIKEYLFVGILNSPQLSLITLWLSYWIIFYGIKWQIAEVFRGFNKIKLAILIGGNGIITLFTLIGIGICLLKGVNFNYLTVICIHVFGNVFLCIFGVSILIYDTIINKTELSEKTEIYIKDIFHIGGPMYITSLFHFLSVNGPILLLGIFSSKDNIAIYGIALRLSTLVRIPLDLANSIISPLIVEKCHKGEFKELEKILRNISSIALIPALCLFLAYLTLGHQIVEILFGSNYVEGLFIIICISFGELYNVMCGPSGNVLNMSYYQMTLMKITVITLLFGLVTSVSLIKLLDINGLGISVMLMIIMHNTLTFLHVRKYLKITTLAYNPIITLRRVGNNYFN